MQAACLARCNGARVELHRGGTFSLEAFRSAVRDTSTSETEHLIASYSRKEFLQTGEASTAHCSVRLHVRRGILLEGVCHGSTSAVPEAEQGSSWHCSAEQGMVTSALWGATMKTRTWCSSWTLPDSNTPQ